MCGVNVGGLLCGTSIESIESIKSIESIESVESSDSIESLESEDSTDSIDCIDSIDSILVPHTKGAALPRKVLPPTPFTLIRKCWV